MNRRALILALALVVLGGVAVGYSVAVSRPVSHVDTAAPVVKGRLSFRDASGQVASVPAADPGAERTLHGLTCERFSTAGDTSVCLQARPGAVPMTDAVILDAGLHEKRRVQLAGIPSRAQVSAGGRMVSWTVFVSGDSYNAGGFSTWTGILDTQTGYLIINIENIQLYLDGERYHSADVNYWGVTFAADGNRFYATVATRGRTYLVEGDYAKWQARTLKLDVECPSLSPDGKRLAYKKRVGDGWRLSVLDLATLADHPLAEQDSVDDQAVWLDSGTVAYAKPRPGGGSDVWAVPADGTGSPRLLLPKGSSPSSR